VIHLLNKAERQQMSKRIASGVTLERDVPVPMSDGVQLMANAFRACGLASWTVPRGRGLKRPIRCSG
jgi:predicted acyl esterase